jgi:hypothetical protein
MANPTTNFGWQMPTASDLVTDLPADFEVFGQAVDTALAELKGGTTGQVLSKTSNTDMDFTWVAQDDANAIQNTQLTAKGALISAVSAGTPATLTVGNNGETLVADSSTSTGLRYQSAYNGNAVINGAFDIAQRGTSISVGAAYPYTLDRWQAVRGGVVAGMTVSRQSSGLTGFQYCARIQRDSGNTSTATLQLFNAFESANSYQFAGQPVTFSFYARAGANYSGGALSGFIGTGTGTDQNPITSVYTGGASSITVSATLNGSTWTRYQGTATLPNGTTEMYVNFTYTPSGTAGANDYVEITGVQVEMGSIATTFKRAGGTIQGELAACQRYYQRLAGGALYSAYSMGIGYSSTRMDLTVPLKVTMRTTPSTFDFSNIGTYDDPAGTITAISGIATTATLNGNDFVWIQATVASGLTQYRNYWIVNNNNAAGYLGFSAEL